MKGFTLIEVMVVVLIMGILSAVIMPKFDQSVEKTRAAEGITALRALAEQQASCLAKYPDSEKCMQGPENNNLFTYGDAMASAETPMCNYGTTAGPATKNFEYWADGQYIIAIRRPCNKYSLETTTYQSNYNEPELNRIGSSNDGIKDWCAILGFVKENNRYLLP